jgi:murein DD-endopeptidase MepM/ murein hydrolase activator NlpD
LFLWHRRRDGTIFGLAMSAPQPSGTAVRLLAALLLAVTAAGCAPSGKRVRQVEDAVRPAAGVAGVTHTVLPGQTLWRIARTYGVPLDELARVNGIDDPAVLDAGRSLFVPGATAVLDVPGLPAFVWPVAEGRIISGFGSPRSTHRHKGLDIAGRDEQPVVAAGPGRVVYSGSTMRGYGKTVIIDHGDALRSLYAHNSALLVQVGQWVERGQAIAHIGRSGNASTHHCHFEIHTNDVAVDPLPFLTAGFSP